MIERFHFPFKAIFNNRIKRGLYFIEWIGRFNEVDLAGLPFYHEAIVGFNSKSDLCITKGLFESIL